MFTEANAAENLVLARMTALGWSYTHGPSLVRSSGDVIIESSVRDALVRFNPEIAAEPSRADEVIHKLHGIIGGVVGEGLVAANEEFMAWLRGQRDPVRLADFDDPMANEFIVANQVVCTLGPERRLDLVGFINGLPLVVGDAKSPARPAESWVDGANRGRNSYENNVPGFFVPNVFSFATDGREYRYGTIGMPWHNWSPWQGGVDAMLRPDIVLDIAQNFTVFATDRKQRKTKVICRYPQYLAANQIVDRVMDGHTRQGLIGHSRGSGKSVLMVFAANKLLMHPKLSHSTVLIVLDDLDLDSQITATLNAVDVLDTIAAPTRDELQDLLTSDTHQVIITTVHLFGEADWELSDRPNIIAFVDEAHRNSQGDIAGKLRESLPNAFLFGLTGIPSNGQAHKTFVVFGADQDEDRYLSRYSFEESIRDGATLPLRFEARSADFRIDRTAFDEALTADQLGEDRVDLTRRDDRFGLLVKAPSRVDAIVEDIAQHFTTRVGPSGFAALIVTIDQEACVIYKETLDRVLSPVVSEVVISALGPGTPLTWRERYGRSPDDEAELLERFRDPFDPLKVLIVTAKLLSGFDAPNLQCLYLDKPLRDNSLLSAICRTNRPAPGKSHGLIVDYLGLFPAASRDAGVLDLAKFEDQLHPLMQACRAWFPDIVADLEGGERRISAQRDLLDNESRDGFAGNFSALAQVWEALSPNPVLTPYEADYRWLALVYESLKPPSGNGKRLWHSLGAKTIELAYANRRFRHLQDPSGTLNSSGATLDVPKSLLDDIDGIVRQVAFPGWQQTAAGEREVRRALRRILLRHKFHTDLDLFDRAYDFIADNY